MDFFGIDAVSIFSGFIGFFSSIYHSRPFLVFEIFAGIYSLILFANIVLLLILRDVGSHYRVGVKGMDIPLVSKTKMKKRWDKVKQRLGMDEISQFKVAIIEADAIVDEILGGIGYQGSNMSEKLEQAAPAHLDEHLDTLKNAHLIRNRIVHDPTFQLDKKAAEEVVETYENFLKYLDYL
jgi:hypothetical protein